MINVDTIDNTFVSFKYTEACFCEEIIAENLSTAGNEKEITVLVKVGDGEGRATAWGCDLTYDYVKINGDYRT